MARQKSFRDSQTIASLRDEAVANPPSAGRGITAFGGAPVLAGNPLDSGERSVGASAASGEAFPTGHGAKAETMIVHRPSPRKVSGASASGAKGAFDATQGLPN